MRSRFLVLFLAVIGIACFIVGAFWLAKNGSYFFFYEDMVKETIQELVKPEYLK